MCICVDTTGSSWIDELRYNPVTEEMEMVTAHGEYTYPGIAMATFRALVGAPSVGRAWHALIHRGRK